MEVFLNWRSHQRPRRENYSGMLAMALEDLEMSFKDYYLVFKRKCLYIYFTFDIQSIYNCNYHYFSVSQVILTLLFLHKTQREWLFGFFFQISIWNHAAIAVLLHCLGSEYWKLHRSFTAVWSEHLSAQTRNLKRVTEQELWFQS